MSWTASAFLAELQSRFKEADELAGVEVWTAPIDKMRPGDNIVFVRVVGEQEWAAIGNQARDDIYTVESSVVVAKKGSGEQAATEVRERASEIIAGVERVLRAIASDSLGAVATAIGATQITKLNLAAFTLTQAANPDLGRWAQLDFDINVTARI